MERRAALSYSTGVAAIEGLAAAAPGASLTVFFVSHGYDTRVVEGPRALIDAAKRARATVVTLMPADQYLAATASDTEWRTYVAAAQASLRTLALETGGMTIFAADDVEPVVQRFAPP